MCLHLSNGLGSLACTGRSQKDEHTSYLETQENTLQNVDCMFVRETHSSTFSAITEQVSVIKYFSNIFT
jgi:hypothetical protein